MDKQDIKYRQTTLELEYLPTKDRDLKQYKKVKVLAPQFTMCTYDVAYEILKDRELGNGCFAVYMALLSYRNTKTNDCHPSIDRIHNDFGLNKKSIKRALDLLYKKGYIDINSGYKNTASNYYFPQEFWYEPWNCDFYQTHAQRRKSPLEEERETKAQKELREKNAEIDRLKRLLAKSGIKDADAEKESNEDEEDLY